MPGASTIGRRRRRGHTLIRLVAYAAPLLVLAAAIPAVAMQGWWLMTGLVSAVLISGLLGAVVLRLERRARTAVAATRARLAASHNADLARYAEEHRTFTEHMVGLLDAASVRVSVLRRRVDVLEREIATTRFLQHTRPVLAHELDAYSRKAATKEWSELWPDLREAPTVVDFVVWDQRGGEESVDDAPLLDDQSTSDNGYEDGEPEQKSA
ncbi:MAG TPA: hypothetical protein VFZ37_13090 [Jiangellaceae bacterium]